MKTIITFCFFLYIGVSIPKNYVYTYYSSGKKMSSGWIQDNKKTDYWFYYYRDGSVKSEGHYKNNQKNGFWQFYNPKGQVARKGHFKNGIPVSWWKYYKNNITEKCLYQKDGATRYCLIYNDKKLIKGSKYINDTFIKEWSSFIDFKRDNPNFSF